MTAAGRRRQRTAAKTDPADALAIARVGLREPALPPPRPHGAIEELRSLVRYRCELTAQRTQQVNRLHADLSQLRPRYHRRIGRLTSAKALDAAARMLRGDNSARARVARDRIKALRGLRRTITGLAADIRTAMDATGTTVGDIDGVGDLAPADIVAHTGDPARFPTKAAFAMANGTAPIEASSGRVRRHRLNRGGNRQTDKAIHTAAIAHSTRPRTIRPRRLHKLPECHCCVCRGLLPGGYGPASRSALTRQILGRVPVVRRVASSVGPAGALLS